MNRARTFRLLGLLSLCVPLVASLSWAEAMSRKPQLPVSVVIAPAQPGPAADAFKPGDVVAFTVKATTLADASEMRLEAKLLGGAELVSGALEWAGAAAKGEEKQISFTVRVPLQGQGRIKATATIMREGKRTVKNTTQYVLEIEKSGKKKLEYQLKKDSKGRDIIEY